MNKRISTLFGLLLFGLVSLAGYLAIRDLVSSQSQQHQQSVSPIFGMIESELVEPLHIATTLDKIGVYHDYFTQQEPDETALVVQLKEYSEKLGLEFYVAHEKSRKQYNSNGRVFDLIEGSVIWYFALKDETDYPVQAVLGNREDVHLYIDVRQYDDNGEFIGFVGVGKPLGDFITSFEQFKKEYGHEFIFVNNRQEIVLSSRQDLQPTSTESVDEVIGIKNIASLPWHENFAKQTQGQVEPSLVVPSKNGDMLISLLSLESLDWSIYLITPLSQRQQAVNQSFALYIGLGLLILFAVYKAVFVSVDYYADKMSRKYNFDPLTKLANRRYADLFFCRQRKKHRSVATIMIGLDNFNALKGKAAHDNGNIVIEIVAKVLASNIRESDLLSRWVGDKFLIILPNIEKAEAAALAENYRKLIEETNIENNGSQLQITASLGVSYSRNLADNLALMAEWSEQAMCQAKREGKNKVALKQSM